MSSPIGTPPGDPGPAASTQGDTGLHCQPVAIIHTPYPEKFSVPRQPGLVTADRSRVQMLGACNREEALRGLEQFSHLWLLWQFHHTQADGWKPTVRPPRLGGNRKVGVFASRSPFRPNPIGLSVVRLLGIAKHAQHWCLEVCGADLVDATPILDIKPYVPYSDALADADCGFAPAAPELVAVRLGEAARAAVPDVERRHPGFTELLQQVLAQQPRPAYQNDPQRVYGTRLLDVNIHWRVDASGACEVLKIE